MLFAHGIALFALTALAVPIAIHMQRRSRARIVDWAAMRFLSKSLANRRRGLTLEYLLLLFCRCLLIACFVLAMAQPSATSLSDFRWVVSLALGFFALIALTSAVISSGSFRKRMATLGVAAGLGGIAALIALWGSQALLDADGQPRDVAIIIDASSSTKIETNGESAFSRFVEDAQLLLDELPGGSTASLTIADALQSLPTPPQRNLDIIAKELTALEPVGGETNLAVAIERARNVIAEGPNEQKQVIVFSDNQLPSWQHVADNLPALNEPATEDAEDEEIADAGVQLYGRLVTLPDQLKDVSVASLELDDELLAVGQNVGVTVDLFNGGDTNVSDLQLELLIDDEVVETSSAIQINAHSHAPVRFVTRFESPNWHTVTAKIVNEDVLEDGNMYHHVVNVVADLPVLIVNGDPTADMLDRSSTFAQLALDPTGLSATGENDQAAAARQGLVRAKVVDVSELAAVEEFSDYQVILLCNVPRLSSEMANQLGEFVAAGGGLFVVLGDRCEPDFYNNWMSAQAESHLMPGQLTSIQKRAPDQSLGTDISSATHPTLEWLVETGEHDLSDLTATTYWGITDWENEQSPIGLRLTNGDPLLIEHVVGDGRVLTFSLSLNPLENNLISRVSFPIVMHLCTRYLASADQLELNRPPERDLILNLATRDLPGIDGGDVELVLPDGSRRHLRATESGDEWLLQVGTLQSAGRYRVEADVALPLAVQFSPDEFDLTAANEEKLAEISQQLSIRWVDDLSQLKKIAHGAPESIDLWRHFAVAALVMIVIEVAVSRWVHSRRRSPDVDSHPSTADTAGESHKAKPQSPLAIPIPVAYPAPQQSTAQSAAYQYAAPPHASHGPPLAEVAK